MGQPLTEWEVEITYSELDDPEHENKPLIPKNSGSGRNCGQRVVDPRRDATWVCTRAAEPPHRNHVAHYYRNPNHRADHDDCVRMAWTGPMTGS